MSDARPRIRLDRRQVRKGDLIEVKTLLSHVMEPGQRKDRDGRTIPRKIIHRFTCEANGKLVFACDLEPAIAANPYLQFKFRAEASGPVSFVWIDDDGARIEASETIIVL